MISFNDFLLVPADERQLCTKEYRTNQDLWVFYLAGQWCLFL